MGKLKQVIVYRVIQSLSIVDGSKLNFFIYIKKKEYTNHWINIEIKKSMENKRFTGLGPLCWMGLRFTRRKLSLFKGSLVGV